MGRAKEAGRDEAAGNVGRIEIHGHEEPAISEDACTLQMDVIESKSK